MVRKRLDKKVIVENIENMFCALSALDVIGTRQQQEHPQNRTLAPYGVRSKASSVS